MPTEATLFVVDDDEQARRSVCALVRSMGLTAEAFESAEKFLDEYVDAGPRCLVTDVRMLGMNGLELQEELQRRYLLRAAGGCGGPGGCGGAERPHRNAGGSLRPTPAGRRFFTRL